METMGDIYKIEKDYKAGDTVEITLSVTDYTKRRIDVHAGKDEYEIKMK